MKSTILPLPFTDSDVARRARRFWPVALVLATLVALVSGAQFATAPRHYTAARQLRVAVIAPLGSVGQDETSQADAAARVIGSPSTVSSAAFAEAILSRLGPDTQARDRLSAVAIEGALSASHHGPLVSLGATWTSRPVAEEILTAAIAALQSQPGLAPSGVGTTVRLQTDGAGTGGSPTPGEESALVTLLLTRIALGALAAAFLPFGLALIEPTVAAARPAPPSR